MYLAMKTVFPNVDAYIDACDLARQEALRAIRKIIKEVVPDAEECISYNMPAYKLGAPIAYFAAYKNHVGFYPTSAPIKEFLDQLTAYKTSKGAIQFPYSQPLPIHLIRNIILYRVEQVRLDQAQKKKVKSN